MPQSPARCGSEVKVQGSSLTFMALEHPLVVLWEKGESRWPVSHISNFFFFNQEKELPSLHIRTISPKTNVLDIGNNNYH